MWDITIIIITTPRRQIFLTEIFTLYPILPFLLLLIAYFFLKEKWELLPQKDVKQKGAIWLNNSLVTSRVMHYGANIWPFSKAPEFIRTPRCPVLCLHTRNTLSAKYNCVTYATAKSFFKLLRISFCWIPFLFLLNFPASTKEIKSRQQEPNRPAAETGEGLYFDEIGHWLERWQPCTNLSLSRCAISSENRHQWKRAKRFILLTLVTLKCLSLLLCRRDRSSC